MAAGTWLRSEIMHPQECDAGEQGVPEEPLEQSDPFSPHGPHCGQHWQPIRYKVSQLSAGVAASIMAVYVIGRPSGTSSAHRPGALWEAGANSTANTPGAHLAQASMDAVRHSCDKSTRVKVYLVQSANSAPQLGTQ